LLALLCSRSLLRSRVSKALTLVRPVRNFLLPSASAAVLFAEWFAFSIAVLIFNLVVGPALVQAFVSRYRTVFTAFRPDAGWFQTFDLLRRIVFVALNLLPSDSADRYAAFALVCGMLLLITATVRPYAREEDNRWEILHFTGQIAPGYSTICEADLLCLQCCWSALSASCAN
jgi:hypothetical protein